MALGSAREGRYCCVCTTKRFAQQQEFFIVPELLFGTINSVYTLLWPRRTLLTVELETRIELPTSARRCRKSELRPYQQPKNLNFSNFVNGSQRYESRALAKSTFRDEKCVRSIRRLTKKGCL